MTYFDTAESYMRSRSESLIGDALSEVRDKIILTTDAAFVPSGDGPVESPVLPAGDPISPVISSATIAGTGSSTTTCPDVAS